MKNDKKTAAAIELLKKQEQRLFDIYSMKMTNERKIAHLKQLVDVLELLNAANKELIK